MTISSILANLFYFETGHLKQKKRNHSSGINGTYRIHREKTENNPKFHLYENELMHLSNDIFFHHPQQSLFAIPTNMFGYILINDENV
jgi:hypothetical protein